MASDESVLAIATQRLKRSIDARRESRKAQLADLKFLAGNSDNKYQWEESALRSRRGRDGVEERPTLTINSLPHHQHQITNEQRQNRPAGKVLPVDDKADPKTAEILTDLVRHVEVSSNVAIALNNACEHQTAHGEGYYRILAEYCDPQSFDQDLRIKQIRNPFAVYDDPDIQDPVGVDRRFAFIAEELTEEEHKAKWPGKEMISVEETGPGDDNAAWRVDGNKVRVVEYYRVEEEERTLRRWSDGSITADDKAVQAKLAQGLMQDLNERGEPVERKTRIPVIKWLKTNGRVILEAEKEVPGPFIPIFRVVGNEYVIDGKVEVSGIVRNAKDPCRMINFWWSQEAEWLSRSPIIPFVGYEGQFDGHTEAWRMANRVALPYLEAKAVTDESGTVLPLPQRMQPPAPPVGIIEAKVQAIDALKSTTGYFDSSLGGRSNETSGVAIRARERQGDIGSYHYVDNLALAVQAHTRYIIEVTPVYFDTQRVARIIGEDGTASHATVDPHMPEAYREEKGENGEIKRIFNPSVGKYDVVATTGASYMTKRQEGAQLMTDVLGKNPALMGVIGDLYFRSIDVAGANEIAERIKRTIDPKVLGEEGDAGPEKLAQAVQLVEALTTQLNEANAALEEKESEQKRKDYEAESKLAVGLAKYLPPDFLMQIAARSLLTGSDLDELRARMPAGGFQGAAEADVSAMQPPATPESLQ